MNERRRFLHVLGATAAVAAIPACGSSEGEGTGGGGAGTTTGAGGAGGAGGSGTTTSTTTTTTTTSSTTTTTTTTTGGGGGAGGGDPNCTQNPAGVAVGTPDSFASEGLHPVKSAKVLIGRDAGGLYALTSICTHQSCDMATNQGTVSMAGVKCNCHGSKFDAEGNVTQGPANKPLKAFALALGCDGQLYVDKSTVVPSSDRLAV